MRGRRMKALSAGLANVVVVGAFAPEKLFRPCGPVATVFTSSSMCMRSTRLAAVIVSLIGCTPAVGPQLPPGAEALTDATELVLREDYSGIVDRSRLVIRDGQAWSEFWNQAYSRQIPTPAVPSIDFGESMVIVASMGGRGTGGYGIAFDAIFEAADILYAVVREHSPGRFCGVTAAESQPVVAVRVPRPGAEVRFIERSETSHCAP